MSRIFDALRKSEEDRLDPASHGGISSEHLRQEAPKEGRAVLGNLEQVTRVGVGAPDIFLDHPGDAGAETFRVLRHRLEIIRRKRPLQKLLVTSAVPKEGKTTIASRLAAALARNRARVLLVDADLRHPGLHRTLGIAAKVGLADWIEGREELASVLRQVEPYGFFYLPAGQAHSNPGELLRQEALGEFLTATAATFDWVVVDSPPLVPFVDAQHLATLVDGVLVVMRCGVTPRSAIEQVFVSLDRAFVAGAVLNGARDNNHGYYQYYGRQRAKQSSAAAAPVQGRSEAGVLQHD